MERPFSFRRLALGVLLLNASGGVLYAILPIFEVEQGGGPLLATLIVGAPLSAQILATFLWGALSDRWGRRRELLVGGIIGQSILFLAYPFLDPVGLLAVRIVQVFLGATSTLATTLVTEDSRRSAGEGLGGLSFWGGVGGALGVVAGYPFLGGAEFRSTSPAALALFLLLAALSAISVGFLYFAGEPARPKAAVPLRDVLEFRSGPWVVRLCLAATIVGVANYVVYTLFPLFVRDILAPQSTGFYGAALNPAQQLALLSLGAGLGGVVVSPLTGRLVERESVRRRLFLAAPVLYAVLWLGFALIRSYAVIFLIWSIPAAIFFQIPLTRELAALTPKEERGRAVGLFGATYSLGGLVASFGAGLAVGRGLSFAAMFEAAALIDLAGFLALGWIVRRGGGMPASATPSPPPRPE